MDEAKDLPIMVEGIVFRRLDEKCEILCLKRTVNEGGWWQPVIGHMQWNESMNDAMKRELHEETGIVQPREIIEDIWHFHWEHNEEMYLEFVFTIEVSSNQEIYLNPEEHDEFRWCSIEEAISLFKYQNNKNAVLKFKEKFAF